MKAKKPWENRQPIGQGHLYSLPWLNPRLQLICKFLGINKNATKPTISTFSLIPMLPHDTSIFLTTTWISSIDINPSANLHQIFVVLHGNLVAQQMRGYARVVPESQASQSGLKRTALGNHSCRTAVLFGTQMHDGTVGGRNPKQPPGMYKTL